MRKDGRRLRFSRYTDSRTIAQAHMQAQVLARELHARGLQPGGLRAVVALPGWCILANDPKEEVWVINPKNLGSWIRSRPAVLTAADVNGIAKFLEDRCRDVEIE